MVSISEEHGEDRAAAAGLLNCADKRCAPLWRNKLLYMIVEHFKDDDPIPVYRRFRDQGRLAPEGLRYVSSWVDEDLKRCFQLMETDHREYLDEWMSNWDDITDFEVYPVITSDEAKQKISPRL